MKISALVQRLTVVGLLGSLSVTQTGCGFLISHGPPVGHEQMDYFTCTEGDAGPIVDVVLGSLNLVGAVIIAANPDAFLDPQTSAASGFFWAVLLGSAAGVGFNKSRKCLEAKRQWAERQMQQRALAADRPVGAPAPVSLAAQLGVQAVVLTPRADTLAVGERVQLVATAHGSSGATIPVNAFTWSSSNDAIASVNNAGLVTANAPGTVVIAANTSNVVGTASVMVAPR